MGNLEKWDVAETIAEAQKHDVPAIPLDKLLSKNPDPAVKTKAALFKDHIRKSAESGDPAAQETLERLLQGKDDPADLDVYLDHHVTFTEKMQEVKKVQDFLSAPMLGALVEDSATFAKLNKLFGPNSASAGAWGDHLLHLAINEPTTFASISGAMDRYLKARLGSKSIAQKLLAKENIGGVTLDAVADLSSAAERRTFIAGKINASKFGTWRKFIDKWSWGLLSKISASSAETAIGQTLDAERTGSEADRKRIATFLESSVKGSPENQLAFLRAARGQDAERGKAFLELQKWIDFEAHLKASWRAGGRPVGFRPNVPAAAAQRQAAFDTWKLDYDTKISTGNLNPFWQPVVASFLASYDPKDLRFLD